MLGQGVEVVRGDMEDPAAMTRAMDGVYGVFSVQNSPDVDAEIRTGIQLADVAKRSRISHFVYSSVGSADQKTNIPHFDSKFRIEEHIRSTGMHFTIVRPVFFMENFLGMRQSIENGTLAFPLDPSTPLQMIAVDDIGGVVAQAFEHSGKWQDRAFELAGDESTMAGLSQAFSRTAGREVHYQQVAWNEFESQAGREMTTMYRWFQDVGYHVDISGVRQEYSKLTPFDRWVNSNWHTAVRTSGSPTS